MALGRTLRAGALVVAAAICATSGCGLPDARPVLPPPTDADSSDTAKQFTFKVPDSTAAPFLGIELYYRIVPVESEPGRELESREELVAGGFRRIASSTDDDPPSLPLIGGPGDGTTITLDFSGADLGEDPAATWDGDGGARSVSLRRAVRSSTDDYKRFACGEFDPGDVDIATVTEELADPNNCEVVQLRLYALSYGATDRTTDRFIVVYSEALNLPSITLKFGRR